MPGAASLGYMWQMALDRLPDDTTSPARATTAPDTDGDADSALIARSRAGDAAAIAALVERHADVVYRIAFRLVGKKAQAEDIAQDVLMRMLSYHEGWLSRASFHVWLRRAVYNRTIDIYRKNRSWQMSDLSAADDIADVQPAPDNALATQEVQDQISAAMIELPLRQRMAVTLCFYEHMSLAEAGEVLKVSVGAVESLLHRAKATLREKLIGLEK